MPDLPVVPLPPFRRDWRRLRDGANWTLEDMAEAVGVSARTVLRWEHGPVRPTGKKAQRYAQVLADIEQRLRQAENGGTP